VSLHKSLQGRDKLKRARNVLSRAERIIVLTEQGRLEEGTSVFGLPKVRVITKAIGGKKKKKKEESEEEDGEGTEEGDVPAGGETSPQQ